MVRPNKRINLMSLALDSVWAAHRLCADRSPDEER
jgi:hypothetical protein